ncbi:MAG: HAMP domain-containing sensor histidine kinase, partial [Campylobacterota bacterium]|nr:HAMP domain-containing sensor histidine kinase [Campylobacterota bacterium]
KYKMGKMDSTLMDKLSLDSKKQIDQMSQTIDDFRDFFKPDREVENFGICEPIYHAAELMKPILEHQGILLRLDLGENISIKGFPHELGQVLVSILNNAKDALADSSAVKEKTVEISLKVDNSDIVILVSDNGGGIPPEIIDTIFDPYFTTKQEKNGTGLGLYMSKTIIEEHCGGKLSVANSSHGAVFKIVLKGKL